MRLSNEDMREAYQQALRKYIGKNLILTDIYIARVIRKNPQKQFDNRLFELCNNWLDEMGDRWGQC